MLGDQFYVDLVRCQVIEDAIIGLPVDPPEPGAADVRDARGELIAEKVEDAEDGIGIPRRVGHDLGGLEFRLLLKDDGKQMEAVAQSSGYCNWRHLKKRKFMHANDRPALTLKSL